MRWLASLAIFKWLGSMAMKWFMGRSSPTNFDPRYSPPPEGQPPYWPQQDPQQHPGSRPPQQPYQSTESARDQDEQLPLGLPDADDGSARQASTPPYPQQPQYYPTPVYQQQPAPRKRRGRKGCLIFALLLAALVTVGIIIGIPFAKDLYEDLRLRAMSAIGLEEAPGADQGGSFPVDDPALPAREVSAAVRDNQLTFTVDGLECGAQIDGHRPTGQFCFVEVTVENTGSEPRYFMMEAQWMIDSAGNRYPGAIWVPGDLLPELLDPGVLVQGQIAFDLPREETATYVQLHESPFSAGVLVDLR